MRDSLRHKKNARLIQNDRHGHWQDVNHLGNFTGVKTGTSGITGIRLLLQASPISCDLLDFRHLVSCLSMEIAMDNDF